MARLKKKDLYEALAAEFIITKKSAKEYVDFIFDEIGASLMDGDSVLIDGFGKFDTKTTKMRVGHDISTGQTRVYPPKTKVQFTPSSGLAEAVDED